MTLYWKQFPINVLPAPPTGINEGTPPPAEEKVTSIPIQTYYRKAWLNKDSQACMDYLNDHNVTVAELVSYGFAAMLLFSISTQDGKLTYANSLQFKIVQDYFREHLATFPESLLEGLIKQLKPETLQLDAIFGWEQIGSDYLGAGAETTQEFSVTEGVETSNESTIAFSESIGASVTATAGVPGFGEVSATLSTEFSASQSTTHSITVSKETSKTRSWTVSENHFYQLWQLYVKFVASDGNMIRQNLNMYQMLTYPSVSQGTFCQLPEGFSGEPTLENLAAHMQKTYGVDLAL